MKRITGCLYIPEKISSLANILPDMEDYQRFVLDSFFMYFGYNMMKLKEKDHNDESITIVIVNQK